MLCGLDKGDMHNYLKIYVNIQLLKLNIFPVRFLICNVHSQFCLIVAKYIQNNKGTFDKKALKYIIFSTIFLF